MAILQKGTKLGVAVHHSVYKPAKNLAELKAQATLFNGWHSKKSWAATTKTPSAYPYISYHYLMATNGDMLKVTDEKYVKYHSGDSFRGTLSFNQHGIAVCLTGNYENDKPTDAQMKALVLFIRDVEKRYKINARVRGHKETSATATACPGKNLGTSKRGWIRQVIANVNDKNYPPAPKPAPKPEVDWKSMYNDMVARNGKLEKELEDAKSSEAFAYDEVKKVKNKLESANLNISTQNDIITKLEADILLLEEKVDDATKKAGELLGIRSKYELEKEKNRNIQDKLDRGIERLTLGELIRGIFYKLRV